MNKRKQTFSSLLSGGSGNKGGWGLHVVLWSKVLWQLCRGERAHVEPTNLLLHRWFQHQHFEIEFWSFPSSHFCSVLLQTDKRHCMSFGCFILFIAKAQPHTTCSSSVSCPRMQDPLLIKIMKALTLTFASFPELPHFSFSFSGVLNLQTSPH